MVNHKSQSELLGFVFVVGIISIGLLIVLGLMLSTPSQSSTYKDKKTLSFLLHSTTQMTTACGNAMRFSSVLLDCAKGLDQLICQNRSLNMSLDTFEHIDSTTGLLVYVSASPDKIGTCAYVTQTLNEITGKTLTPWAGSYELLVQYQSKADPSQKKVLYKKRVGTCANKIPSLPYSLADYSQGKVQGEVVLQAFVCE
jgi:hypothetical protein